MEPGVQSGRGSHGLLAAVYGILVCGSILQHNYWSQYGGDTSPIFWMIRDAQVNDRGFAGWVIPIAVLGAIGITVAAHLLQAVWPRTGKSPRLTKFFSALFIASYVGFTAIGSGCGWGECLVLSLGLFFVTLPLLVLCAVSAIVLIFSRRKI